MADYVLTIDQECGGTGDTGRTGFIGLFDHFLGVLS